MILPWVALGFAVVLLGMAVWKPYLFQLGWAHAKARRGQTLTIILGLGTAMGVLVGAAVASDSAGIAQAQYEESLQGSADLDIWVGSNIDAVEKIPLILADVAPGAVWAPQARYYLDVDARDGSSMDSVFVFGAEPAHEEVTGWDAIDGNTAGWRTGAMLTKSMARQLHTGVGDELTFYDSLTPRYSTFTPNEYSTENESYDAKLTLAAAGPDGYFHSDEDVYQFDFQAGSQLAYIRIEAPYQDSQVTEGVVMEVTLPNGTVMVDTGLLSLSLSREDAFLDAGTYRIEIHADLAVDLDVQIVVDARYLVGTPDWVLEAESVLTWTAPVIAVVEDSASPRYPEAVLIGHDFIKEQGTKPFIREYGSVLVRLPSGADSAAIASAIERHSLAAGNVAVVYDLTSEAEAAEQGARTGFFVLWATVGGMTITAGLALIFVIMALVVEERRATLATLRATGATTTAIASMHLAEALVYGLLAVIPALLLGLSMAAVLDVPVGAHIGRALVIRPIAVAAGIGVSIGLVLGASAFAALRSGRLHIPTALRGEEKPGGAATWPRMVGGASIALYGLAYAPGLLTGSAVAITLVPCALVLAAAVFIGGRIPRHIVFPAAAAVIVIWLVITRAIANDFASAAEVLLMPIRALLFCAAAAILFAYARPIHSGLAALWRRSRFGVPIEASLAYIRGRPGRGALTIFVLALVLLGVVFLGTVAPDDSQLEWRGAGGFDAVGPAIMHVEDLDSYLQNTPAPNGYEPWDNVARYEQVEWLSHAGDLSRGIRPSGEELIHVMGVTGALVTKSSFYLLDGPDVVTGVNQLLTEPGTAFLREDWEGQYRETLLESGDILRAGDVVEVIGSQGTTSLRIAGILPHSAGPQMWVSPATLATLAANSESDVTTGLWVKANPGVDPEIMAWEVERAFPELGFLLEAKQFDRVTPAIMKMFSVFTILTLTIGAVALGLVTSRNAMSRRRQIGAMRALGAQQTQVVIMVMAEAMYLVVIAATIGILGTLVTLAGLPEIVEYNVPWAWALGLAAYSILAAGVAAIIPAWAAARRDPAEAARYVE